MKRMFSFGNLIKILEMNSLVGVAKKGDKNILTELPSLKVRSDYYNEN